MGNFHSDKLPIEFEQLGRWWGNNSKEKRQEEFDLIAYKDNVSLFIECKYRNQVKVTKVYDDLVRKSELFNQFDEKQYLLFLKEQPSYNSNTPIITLEYVIHPV